MIYNSIKLIKSFFNFILSIIYKLYKFFKTFLKSNIKFLLVKLNNPIILNLSFVLLPIKIYSISKK